MEAAVPRIWFSYQRFLGIRPGISFALSELTKKPSRKRGGQPMPDPELAENLLRQAAPYYSWRQSNYHRSEVATSSGHKTLTQLGISKQQSSDWQKLAADSQSECTRLSQLRATG
jgi:hypothetical protein